VKLNLACGEKQREGWENWDISPDCLPGKVVDVLKFPWEVRDGEVSEIYCSHFIEHIGSEFIPFMEECWRVLTPGGIAHFETPYYTSVRAWQDPTHKRPISEFTFHYFNKEWLKSQGIGHYNIKADFKIEEIRYHYPPELKGMPKDELQSLQNHAWNTVMDFEVILKAIKGDANNEKLDRKAPANGKPGHDAGNRVI
jgi:SAM-dependent methyltransferase